MKFCPRNRYSSSANSAPPKTAEKPVAAAAKPRQLDGYVGFASLPNQVYRKAVKKGFEFTLMVSRRFFQGGAKKMKSDRKLFLAGFLKFLICGKNKA